MTKQERIDEFKARWAEADALGMEGRRVEYALAPLLEAMETLENRKEANS